MADSNEGRENTDEQGDCARKKESTLRKKDEAISK